jgi:predicted metal-dependent phosphoesterase TrpH
MIDLHCHTKASDNSLSIFEVIDLARREGVTHLAITDHDTTKGLEAAARIGDKLGVTIIPGIEISAYDLKRDARAHLLGFHVTPNHPALDALCKPLIEKRHKASHEMTQKLIEAGYEITWGQVQQYAAGGTGVYKQHIMHALMEKGYTSSIYSDLYKKLFSRCEGGQDPGIAYVPLQYIDMFDAIGAIREAGGVPVLAHPTQFNSWEAIPEWFEAGLEGIEVWHPLHDEADEKLARQYAQRFNLVQTGGTDFHGFYGDATFPFGSKNPGLEAIQELKERKEQIGSELIK